MSESSNDRGGRVSAKDHDPGRDDDPIVADFDDASQAAGSTIQEAIADKANEDGHKIADGTGAEIHETAERMKQAAEAVQKKPQ